MKPGFLYLLVHPSDPDLYKIGVTVLQPEKRLAQHNRQHEKTAGWIVKETGLEWQLKTFIAVADPYHAEEAFRGATWIAAIPRPGRRCRELFRCKTTNGYAAIHFPHPH